MATQYGPENNWNYMNDMTKFIIHSKCGYLEGVKFYVDTHDCDPRELNNYAIQVASAGGHQDVVDYLLTVGGDRNFCVEQQTDNNLIFEIACRNGHLDILKCFISLGIRPTNPNIIEHASGQERVVEYLRSLSL